MRLTKKNRARAQVLRADYLARAKEIQKLDQSSHDKDPKKGSVKLDSFEFQHEGESAWRNANASFGEDGAVLELKMEDRRVVFKGELNDLYGTRKLEIGQGEGSTVFSESYTEPMYNDFTTISVDSKDGHILEFDQIIND